MESLHQPITPRVTSSVTPTVPSVGPSMTEKWEHIVGECLGKRTGQATEGCRAVSGSVPAPMAVLVGWKGGVTRCLSSGTLDVLMACTQHSLVMFNHGT